MNRRAACFALIGIAGRLSAQQVPVVTLRPADAVLAEEFTSLASARELSDGRVLLSDRRERRLVVADFATGKVEPIGRRGAGPGEYNSAPVLLPLAGDSTLASVSLQRRWLVLAGSRIVETVPPDAKALLATRGRVEGSDRRGRVLTRVTPPLEAGVTRITERDSQAVVLVDRRTGAVDTVAYMRRQPAVYSLTLNAAGEEVGSSFDLLGVWSSEESAALFPDGALAVARLGPFRVDWRLSDGRWIRGNPLPVPAVPVDSRQKAWYMQGRSSDEMPKAGDWPKVIPPFLVAPGTLVAAPDGRLLVRRSRDADHADVVRYLIVDRSGRATGELRLGARESILAFGARSVYVAATDDDGIQRLRRHPWV